MFTKKTAELGLFYCAFIWGSTFVVTKYALNAVDPSAMVAIRFFVSALALLPFVIRKKNFFAHIKEAFVLSFFLACLYLTQTAGLFYTTASNSGFITGLFIIFIPIFLFLFKKEKPGFFELLASLTAVIGMWFLTGGIAGINKGDLLTLIAAMSYSAHLLFTDKYVKGGYDITKLAFHQFWLVALISCLAVIISGKNFYVANSGGWLVILFLAFFPTLSAFFIQMNAQKYSDPFKVGIIFTLEPVFAAAFAWTVGGEDFFAVKAFGGFLIFSAMLINEIGKIKDKKTAQ
jgi:drug/metabolite transporter (DMT)-like permease